MERYQELQKCCDKVPRYRYAKIKKYVGTYVICLECGRRCDTRLNKIGASDEWNELIEED